jgi:hypothetical protein
MEIKTAEIVRGEGERESKGERETSTETTMREKLGISCCVLCIHEAFGFPWGGMMMLNEGEKKIPNPKTSHP